MSKLNNDFNVHRSIDCLNLNILKENINSNSPPPVLKNNRFTKNLLRRRSSNLVADLASVGNHENFYTYELIQQIAQYLLDRTTVRPKIGIICGSGLGNLADVITDSVSFPYHEIPHFPISTVAGHVGRLVFGNLDGVPIMCMQGRFHYYEGYPLWKCSMPVRVMKLVGVTHLIVTNAAGGLNPKYRAGDIMLMKDHINFLGFAGNNPLQGVNDERFGPRFPAMNRAYNASLRKAAQKIAKEMGIEKFVREGVYAVVGGPNFETIAECRMLRICGVDAVGMSTVHEVLTAQHCDMKVFAFSLITNKCVTDYESMAEATHEENIDTGIMREGVIKKLVTNVVRHISNNDSSQPTKNGSSVTNKTSHTFNSST